MFFKMCVLRRSYTYGACILRQYSGAATYRSVRKCKLLVVGGGTGGCSTAWRFARRLKGHEIIVLEPSEIHYYQPQFTLIAAGLKDLKSSIRPMAKVLPPEVTWCQDQVEEFDPTNCAVYTKCGNRICYEYMVVAVGLQNRYDKIPGLKQALDDPNSPVSTIYSPEYCEKTFRCMKATRGGHAVFSYPAGGGKCSGAAQKVMYLADDYWRRRKIRPQTNITYNTCGQALFGVPKYAKSLCEVARGRDITVNCNTELIELTPQGAVFATGCQNISLPYNFLHVTPPMCPPACLSRSPLADEAGFLSVDRGSLQHNWFRNVYGIGDCTSTPNSKTAAAVAAQSHVLEQNLVGTMAGQAPTAKYDGYGACTVLTSYRKGILAEFDYDKKLMETLPIDQSKERRLVYILNTRVYPYLYWNKLIKGKWNGPARIRKIINPSGR